MPEHTSPLAADPPACPPALAWRPASPPSCLRQRSACTLLPFFPRSPLPTPALPAASLCLHSLALPILRHTHQRTPYRLTHDAAPSPQLVTPGQTTFFPATVPTLGCSPAPCLDTHTFTPLLASAGADPPAADGALQPCNAVMLNRIDLHIAVQVGVCGCRRWMERSRPSGWAGSQTSVREDVPNGWSARRCCWQGGG